MDTSVIFWLLNLLTVDVLYLTKTFCFAKSSAREFTIDFDNNQFLKDGKPFRFISGSLPYTRTPEKYWQHKLQQLKYLGVNTVSTFIDWGFHEVLPGQFVLSGEKDVVRFIKLAQKEGLLVILRPGPYINSETSLGGYPGWLFNIKPDILLRSSDPVHTKYVSLWYKQLFPKLQPLLYGNGGPIIMLQVENNYGSYIICDRTYTVWLRDLYRSYVGDKAVLFTTDVNDRKSLQCTISGVFKTVNFGPQENVSAAFDPLREVQSSGPLVNSQFYVGTPAHWGAPAFYYPGHPTIEETVNAMMQFPELNASFDIYMVYGGTNCGFQPGSDQPFRPLLTSADYYYPITESGIYTIKYFAIKDVLSKFQEMPVKLVTDFHPVAYGPVEMTPKVALFDSNNGISYGAFEYPQTFESLKQYTGFMLYETTLPQSYTGQGNLTVERIHDRTIVYIDKDFQGILSRTYNVTSLQIGGKGGQTMGLLVENQSYLDNGNMRDLKGLLSNVTLNGVVLTNWTHKGYPMNVEPHISTLPPVSSIDDRPRYYSGQFKIPHPKKPYHGTFLDMTGWTKGFVWMNGVNLGRYWPALGPQITLFCPGCYLNATNVIEIMELEAAPPSRTVTLVGYSLYRNVTPYNEPGATIVYL